MIDWPSFWIGFGSAYGVSLVGMLSFVAVCYWGARDLNEFGEPLAHTIQPGLSIEPGE